MIAAVRNNRFADHLIRVLSLSGIAHTEVLARNSSPVCFQLSSGDHAVIGRGNIIPANITGLWLLDSLLTLNFPAFFDSLKHIIIPAVSLAIASAAQIMRLTRTNMMEQLNKEYIVAAKSYGLPKNIIINQYMLKNAFITILSVIGMQFGSLLGNAFLVENRLRLARYGLIQHRRPYVQRLQRHYRSNSGNRDNFCHYQPCGGSDLQFSGSPHTFGKIRKRE